MELQSDDIQKALQRLGQAIRVPEPIVILVIGGAAGMATGQLPASRTTTDCDVIHFEPATAREVVASAARMVADDLGLPETWLNAQAQQLNILPDGWRNRRQLIGLFGKLHVFAIGRLDLLATKCYANRPADRHDIWAMHPTSDELIFVRQYLNMLRVPARRANLDQVTSALRLVAALEEDAANV